ncbi:hypothetical protein [Halobacillus sp. A5]|uniref:hypothetical protein n=1 Tax=Halobacillus sp. A5 TaxID=2880263 RepID=UPI0020A624C1|nr:hypothetical protein [Halobacillus sp. A5]MCP3026410.1 hypothetical protein [Halobacillus sp. A5]
MAPNDPVVLTAVYYIWLFVTMSTAVIMVVKRRHIRSSIGVVVLVPVFVVINIVGTIPRTTQTETAYWVGELMDLKLWVLFSLFIMMYLLLWWGHLLRQYRKK